MSGAAKFKARNESARQLKIKAQNAFLAQLANSGGDVKGSLEVCGIKRRRYEQWREREPEFRARVDAVKRGKLKGATWDGGFASFRQTFFGMTTTWFQQLAVEQYEKTPLGNILLLLWPPEHGKTTLFEDYASMRLALDPQWRFMVGGEKIGFSSKVLQRVMNRMEPVGPFPQYVQQFGPFRPQPGMPGPRQPWNNTFFSVFKKGNFDERNYSMEALGFGSAVSGNRTDHMHLDDIQSTKSLNQTDAMMTVLRQDWFTRPGERGIVTINATRVGEDDIYHRLMEEIPDDILRVIQFPAIWWDEESGEYKPLWEQAPDGSGYTMAMLDRIRAKVGDEVWYRTYLQNPRAAGNSTWTEAIVHPCRNPARRLGDFTDVDWAVITVDPALGGKNCIGAFEFTPEKLRLLELYEDVNLSRNEQIMERLELMLAALADRNVGCTDVVIESMNFQRGLARDDRLLELQRRYGFNLSEHLTGVNKYDENIGLPSMATTFRREEFEFPWHPDDERTRREMEQFEHQLYSWRPNVSGKKLRQDRVMVTWFAWILWRERRKSQDSPQEQFRTQGMTFTPTLSGLYTPIGPR